MADLAKFRKIKAAKFRLTLLAAFAFGLFFFALGTPVNLAAENSDWNLQPADSYAELFVGSMKNPYSYSPGAAHVSGKLVLNAEDLNKTILNLTIYPADANTSPDGNGPAYSELRFNSKRAVLMPGGELAVTGDLILRRVERPVEAADANEAFAGPIYGAAIVKVYRTSATFVLPAMRVSEAAAWQKSKTISAGVAIGYENFPQLLPALLQTNWPVVVQDEHCTGFGNIEDFSGQPCTGTVIAASSQNAAPTWLGEDYSGSRTAIAGNLVTIKLKLTAAPDVFHQLTTEETEEAVAYRRGSH